MFLDIRPSPLQAQLEDWVTPMIHGIVCMLPLPLSPLDRPGQKDQRREMIEERMWREENRLI